MQAVQGHVSAPTAAAHGDSGGDGTPQATAARSASPAGLSDNTKNRRSARRPATGVAAVPGMDVPAPPPGDPPAAATRASPLFRAAAKNKMNSNGCKRCTCKRSKCLKLYCDCFAAKQYCTGCTCIDCHNREENAREVRVAGIRPSGQLRFLFYFVVRAPPPPRLVHRVF
jgi:hypothetical protein